MRNRTIAVSGVLLCLGALLFGFRPTGVAQTELEGSLNTVSLNFDASYLDPLEGNNVIRAFVPTHSKSVNCLTSLNEIGTNIPLPGIVVFCGEREPSGFGNVPGVLVSIFFPQTPAPDLVMSVTLYQQGARRYGTPVLCNGNSGC
jgi:hypothetical protein